MATQGKEDLNLHLLAFLSICQMICKHPGSRLYSNATKNVREAELKPPLAGRGIIVSARKHKNLAWAIRARERNSGIQINPHSKQLRAEEAHDRRVHGAARQVMREPALTLTPRIIVGEQTRRARVPASP